MESIPHLEPHSQNSHNDSPAAQPQVTQTPPSHPGISPHQAPPPKHFQRLQQKHHGSHTQYPQIPPHHIGMRNIKTALAATLCALLYFPFERNPTFACIGAIFGLGNDMTNSWINGGNRLFGTIIGGFIGMVAFRIYIIFHPQGGTHPLMFLILFVGVIILIMTCRLCKWPGGIQPGGVVLCIILFNTPVDTYIAYSLNRMLDTAIGVIIAWVINILLPRQRILHWTKMRNEFHDKLAHSHDESQV